LNRNRTVLIVEDETNLGKLLKFLLEENGLEVLIASDGQEAIELFKLHIEEIGVVLSDLGLPKLGGWEAFSEMKELKPGLKGILSSGYFSPAIKKDILKSGAHKFIQKPYNTVEIVSMIKGLLEE
jgi:two-component system, cell cycle sensor histidine kinase and response regulator CckA